MTREEFIKDVLPLKNKLFAYAISIMKNRQEAEDVTQDVLIKVWEQSSSQQHINNIEAWCMTMTRNRSLDKLKLKSRNNLNIDDQFDVSNDDKGPLRILEMNDLKQKLRKVVSSLPVTQREAIQLRDFQGHTYQEIADIMDMDMNRVKVTIHRARKFIQNEILKLNAYGIEQRKYS